MTNQNMEIMKRLVEEKKKKSAEQSGNNRHNKKIGSQRKGVKKFKKGGLFDK